MHRFLRASVAVGAAACLGGAVLAAAAFAQAAPSGTVYVSPTGSDVTGNGSQTAPYQSIQKALGAAAPGSTVILDPGTYRTMVSITKAVTLESEPGQAGVASRTVIDAAGQLHGIVIEGATASGTAIRGLTVEDALDIGILVQDTQKIIIANDIVTHNALGPNLKGEHKGIQLEGVSDSIVESDAVTGNALGGIRLADSATRPATGNTISGNTVTGNGGDCGIVVSSGTPSQGTSDNTVAHNHISLNPVGIVVAGRATMDNRILDNAVTRNFAAGIVVHANAPGDVIKGNIIQGNTLSGNGQGTAAAAIVVGANVTPVQGTTVSGNTIAGEYYGVWLARAAGTVLTANQDAATVAVPVYTYPGQGDMPPAPQAQAAQLPKTGADPRLPALGLTLMVCGLLLLTWRRTGKAR